MPGKKAEKKAGGAEKAAEGGPTEQLRAALADLGVAQVPAAVWEQVVTAENAWTLEVVLGVDVNWEALPAVRTALQAAAAASSEEVWPVLQELTGELPALRGLLCIIASGDTAESTGLYFDVLAIPGATGNGAFRPALFRHALGILRSLRKADGDEEPNLDGLPVLHAVGRCIRCVTLPDEAFSLTLENVAMLVRHPCKPEVQTAAADVMGGIIDPRHGDIRKVFLTAAKALLPAGLMTGDSMKCMPGSHLTKALATTRKAVVGILSRTIEAHPELCEHIPVVKDEPMEEGEGVLEGAKKLKKEEAPNPDAPKEVPGEAEALADPVVTLLQHWLYWTPERADWRAASAESIVVLLQSCDRGVLARFAAVLVKFLTAERPTQRMLALDASLAVADAFPGELPVQAQILQRCRDVAPTVRARAFTGLGLLVHAGADGELTDMLTNRESPKFVDVAALFLVHVQDAKPMVRKAALNVFDALLPFLADKVGMPEADVAKFFSVADVASRTLDESLMVRKAACGALCKLLAQCPNSLEVQQAWARSVMPLIQDAEQSVAERALDEVEKHVLVPLERWGRAKPKELGDVGVFSLLSEVGEDSDSLEFLARAWRLWWKKATGKAEAETKRAAVLAAVHKGVELVKVTAASPKKDIHRALALWSLAEESVSLDPKAIDPATVLKAWDRAEKHIADDRIVLVATRILRVLQATSEGVAKEQRAQLVEKWRSSIADLTQAPALASEMLRAVDAFLPGAWKQLMPDFSATVCDFAVGKGGEQLGPTLFAIGEISLFDGAKQSKFFNEQLATAVQCIATNTVMEEGNKVNVDDEVRGHAVICWGKMCLGSEQLAKRSIEALVVHLGERESFTVRNNVLLVLSDICVQYTSLVDRFVPLMTNCLNARNELLRKHAVMVLSHLLSEDFIKFKGSIQHRFLYCLADPSESVREFVEAVFERILLHRMQSPANVFIDAISALNGWTDHPLYQGATGNSGFSFAQHPERREMVYLFLLNRMSNEQKFNTLASIVTSLLAAFADDSDEVSIELPSTYEEPGGRVLCDCLKLLACKELKVQFAKKEGDADADVAAAGAEAQAEASKEKVVSALMRKHMCDNVVPVLVMLKNLMEHKRSPFLRELRACLVEMLREFRDDLPTVLDGNMQLAREIEFDERLAGPGSPLGKDSRRGLKLHVEPRAPHASPHATPAAKPEMLMSAFPSRRLSISTKMKPGAVSRVPKVRRADPDDPVSAVRTPGSPVRPAATPRFETPRALQRRSAPSPFANQPGLAALQDGAVQDMMDPAEVEKEVVETTTRAAKAEGGVKRKAQEARVEDKENQRVVA